MKCGTLYSEKAIRQVEAALDMATSGELGGLLLLLDPMAYRQLRAARKAIENDEPIPVTSTTPNEWHEQNPNRVDFAFAMKLRDHVLWPKDTHQHDELSLRTRMDKTLPCEYNMGGR